MEIYEVLMVKGLMEGEEIEIDDLHEEAEYIETIWNDYCNSSEDEYSNFLDFFNEKKLDYLRR